MYKVSSNNAGISDSLPEEVPEELEAPVDTSSVSETGDFSSTNSSGEPDTASSVSGGNAANDVTLENDDIQTEQDADAEPADEFETVSGNETLSGNNAGTGNMTAEELADQVLLEEGETADYEMIVQILEDIRASEQRQEKQNEASLSVLLFFLVIVALWLIYRFFRLFI